MARRPTTEALAALGAERLAALVLDEMERSAPFKRIVTAALAGTKGADAVAALIDRRLGSLEKARGRIGFDKRRAFVADLAAVVATITDELGRLDPAAAGRRLLRFLGGAGAVLDRSDDPSGTLLALFERAAAGVPGLVAASPDDDRGELLDQLAAALAADEGGFVGAALAATAAVLGPADRAALDRALAQAGGPTDPRDLRQQRRRDRLLRARKAIADAGGDVDGFIALEMQRPDALRDTLDIAERLLAAGRAAEALRFARMPDRHGSGAGLRVATTLDEADGGGGTDPRAHRRLRLEIAILAASGEKDAAQRLRWSTFERELDAALLRAYLAALPDFEDDEALERALAHAAAHPGRHRALAFLLEWPRLDLAAALVLRHAKRWDGRHYGVLAPAADALQHDHPAAATVLYRALLADILDRGRSQAYGHAARYLAALAAITPAVDGDHRAYRDALRRTHGRKHGFWSLVKD